MIEVSPAESLLIRFEATPGSDTYLIDAWVDTKALEASLVDADAFDKMTEALCDKLGFAFRNSMEQRVLQALPLINNHPLAGAWVCGSPMGMESTNPVPRWNFDRRKQSSLINPELYPLLQGEFLFSSLPQDEPIQFYVDKLRTAIEDQLGAAAVTKIEATKIPGQFDHLFESSMDF